LKQDNFWKLKSKPASRIKKCPTIGIDNKNGPWHEDLWRLIISPRLFFRQNRSPQDEQDKHVVTTAISGKAIRVRFSISPKWLVPSSTIIIFLIRLSAQQGQRQTYENYETFGDWKTLKCRLRTWCVICLVVVLPAEPVIADNLEFAILTITSRQSHPSAFIVSSYLKNHFTRNLSGSISWLTTAQTAPLAKTSAIKFMAIEIFAWNGEKTVARFDGSRNRCWYPGNILGLAPGYNYRRPLSLWLKFQLWICFIFLVFTQIEGDLLVAEGKIFVLPMIW